MTETFERLSRHLAQAQQELTNAALVLIEMADDESPRRLQCEIENAIIRLREAGECVKVARAIVSR